MWVICDIETNRLENPDKIHCIVCKDVDTGNTYTFIKPTESSAFSEFARGVDVWIGHYFLGFDYIQINRLVPNTCINPSTVIDTLVVARLAIFADWNTDDGKPKALKHSLEAWGERFGIQKLHTEISFENFSEELLERCVSDVEITHKLYLHLKDFIFNPDNKLALDCEHEQQLICNDLHTNGFSFNYSEAQEIHTDLLSRLDSLASDLHVAFRPRSKLIREITPRPTKHGTLSRTDFRWLVSNDLTPYTVGWPFSRFELIPFNPGSPNQRIEVLNEAGWKPFDKTKGHIAAEKQFKETPTAESKARLDHFKVYGWKTSEDNLETLPASAPEASRKLVEWLLLNARRSTLEEWFNAYTASSGRIHGSFSPIGAWTHRKAHSKPNMGNVPSKESKYNGKELKELAKEFGIKLRSLFTVPPRRLLIGTDADGIQGRIFAHYIRDDGFIESLVNGSSEQGTDIHTRHFQRLAEWCPARSNAKTFFYAWLLGAGASKVANIFGCSIAEARIAIKIFLDIYPGLAYLKGVVIPADANNGYFIGFDGRLVPCPSEYYMLAGYLQNGEACIMKHAEILWRKQLTAEGIYFKQVNDVHDEWQTEVEDDMDQANYIGKVQADSIRIVAEGFNLNCPFKGNYKIGHNWNETH